MSRPKRPANLAELRASLAGKVLQEDQHLEFKRDVPSREEIARQCAALAAEGGALVLGVVEGTLADALATGLVTAALRRVDRLRCER